MATYVYERLDPGELRILQLSPGKIGDPLFGTLKIFDMPDAPEYTAISYAWGEAVFPHKLHLAGGYLKITKSLYEALRSCRSRDISAWIWADQVCIAQHDVTEKNHQVDSIANIYREAEGVLVWLGEARESDCLAFWTLGFLNKFRNDVKRRYGNPPMEDPRSTSELPAAFNAYNSEGKYKPSTFPACCLENIGDIDLERCLHSLTQSIWSRLWFDRLWVVQEVAVAQMVTVRFGHHDFGLHDLWHGAYIHLAEITGGFINPRSCETSILRRCERLLASRETYQRRVHHVHQSLLSTLLATHGLKAKEDHDRIYAVRALAHIESFEELEPDYEIPILELWTRATIVILTEVSPWHVQPYMQYEPPALCLALVGTQRVPSNPSWVLNVESFTEQSFITRHVYSHKPRDFKAGSKLPLEVVYHRNVPELLCLRGVFACRVLDICPESVNSAQHCGGERSEAEKDAVALHGYSANQYGAFYHFTYQEDSTSPERYDLEEFCELMRQGIQLWRTVGDTNREGTAHPVGHSVVDEILKDYCPDDDEFFSLLEKVIPINHIDCTRVFASTSTGEFGWVPGKSQPGDTICLFQGCPYPFVIRDREDGYYTLLGDAYVEGIMHGEAWPEKKDDTYMIGLK